MFRPTVAAIVLAFLSLLLHPLSAIGQEATTGEILVGFVESATEEQADALIRSYGLTWESQFQKPMVDIWVRLPGQSVDPYVQAEPYIQEFEKNEAVLWAQVRGGHPDGVPGGLYVMVQFAEGVSEVVARSVVQSVSGVELFDVNVTTAPKWGVVKVPAGEEQKWIDEFTRLVWNDPTTIVRYAERNQIFGPLDQNQRREGSDLPERSDPLPNGDVFQPQIIDAPVLPSFIALPLPLLMFFAGGIVVALFVILIFIVLFFMRRKKTPELPRDDMPQTHRAPLKKLFLVLFVVLLSLGYLVLFRSPLRLSRNGEDTGQTEIVGNVKAFQQFLASHTRRMTGGLLGSNNLCPDDDCSPPPRPEMETERVTVSLTGGQITDLVARFKPKTVLVSNIQIQFEDGKGYATGTSFYPFLPGVVSVEATASLGRFRLEKGWLGQIPIPQRQYALINDGANFLIFNFLESIGVSVDEFDIVGDKIVATAQVPRGLIRVEGDTVIVNVDILTGSTGGGEIEVRTPTAPILPTSSPQRFPDVESFVSKVTFDKPGPIQVLIDDPTHQLKVFWFNYGEPSDCIMGCVYQQAAGIWYNGKAGWIYPVIDDDVLAQAASLPSESPVMALYQLRYQFDASDTYLFSDEFTAQFREATSAGGRYVPFHQRGFLSLLARDAGTPPDVLLKLSQGHYDKYPPLDDLLDNPVVQKSRAMLEAIMTQPGHTAEYEQEIRARAKQYLNRL